MGTIRGGSRLAGSRALSSGVLGYETIRHSFLAVTEWRVFFFFLLSLFLSLSREPLRNITVCNSPSFYHLLILDNRKIGKFCKLQILQILQLSINRWIIWLLIFFFNSIGKNLSFRKISIQSLCIKIKNIRDEIVKFHY